MFLENQVICVMSALLTVENVLENHPESRATPAEEYMEGFGDKESQAREDQMMLTPNPSTASSLIVLGPCDQRNLHKVT